MSTEHQRGPRSGGAGWFSELVVPGDFSEIGQGSVQRPLDQNIRKENILFINEEMATNDDEMGDDSLLSADEQRVNEIQKEDLLGSIDEYCKEHGHTRNEVIIHLGGNIASSQNKRK